MTGVVLDTHAIIWHLLDSPRLSENARKAMDETMAHGGRCYISAISVLETLYLVEKNRIPTTAFDQLVAVLHEPESDVHAIPVSVEVAVMARSVSRAQVPDLPDRIIAATALHIGVPVITRDRRIQEAGVETLW